MKTQPVTKKLTLREVTFMNESWDDMRIFQIARKKKKGKPFSWVRIWHSTKKNSQVIVRPKDIRRDSRSKVATILILIRTTSHSESQNLTKKQSKSLLILNVNHPFRMGISKVTLMWGSTMNLGLIERILDFVRKDTSREAWDHLGRRGFVSGV